MPVLVLPYPNIDPVAFSAGPFDVRWYGLAYAAGLMIGWMIIRSLVGNPALWGPKGAPFEVDRSDDLVLWTVIGVVLGGRLGQVLLYDVSFYLANPLEIFKVWKGGMSFHGAFAGSAIAIILFARKYNVPLLSAFDLCSAGIPPGIILGRLGNFINSEHWGHPTDVPWAMVFPDGGPLPRHPSQIYEALLEGLALWVIMRFVTHTVMGLERPGLVAGVWCAWYAIARIICEMFRTPEAVHALNIGPLTAGQVYSLPMLAIGMYLIVRANRTQPALGQRT